MKKLVHSMGWIAVSCFILSVVTGCDVLIVEESVVVEYEPNNSRTEAYDLGVLAEQPIVILSELFDRDDVDFYKFKTEESDRYKAVQIALSDAAPTLRGSITVLDEDGNEIMNKTASNKGAELTFVPRAMGGVFYLKISQWLSDDGAYRLTVTDLREDDAYEANEERTAAYDLGQLTQEPIQLTGSIVHRDELDFYRFETNKAERYKAFELSFKEIGENLRPSFTVYDEDGNERDNKTASAKGANVTEVVRSMGGVFFVEVGQWLSEYGAYTMTLTDLGEDDAFEPNETRDEAYDLGDLSSGDIVVEASIVQRDEVDFYRFDTAGAPGQISITIDNVGSELRASVSLIDSQGNQIDNKSSSNEGANVTLSSTSSETTFFVKVDQWLSSHGPYKMTISAQ